MERWSKYTRHSGKLHHKYIRCKCKLLVCGVVVDLLKCIQTIFTLIYAYTLLESNFTLEESSFALNMINSLNKV